MSRRNVTRNEFLRDGSCLAAGALLVNIATPGAAAAAEPACQQSDGRQGRTALRIPESPCDRISCCA